MGLTACTKQGDGKGTPKEDREARRATTHPGGRVLHADHLVRRRQRQVLRVVHADAGTGWHVFPRLGVQGQVVHPLDNVREV